MEGECGESENSVTFGMGLERERECSRRRKGEFGKNGDERLMGEYDHGDYGAEAHYSQIGAEKRVIRWVLRKSSELNNRSA